MTSPWRPVEPLEPPDPPDPATGAGGDLARRAPAPDPQDTSALDEFASEAEGALDLVWLGDASRGLDEFAPVVQAASPALANDEAPRRPFDADAPPLSSPFRGTPPPPPWRLRRVVLPALMVLAGVAVVSNLETQAPTPPPALPEPPRAQVSGQQAPEIRTAFVDPPLSRLPDAVVPDSPRDWAGVEASPPAPLEPPPVDRRAPAPPPRQATAVTLRPPATPPASQAAVRPTPPPSQTIARESAPGGSLATPPPSVAAIAEEASRAPENPVRTGPPATRIEPPAVPQNAAAVPAPAAEPPRPAAERAEARAAASPAAPTRETATRAIEQVLGQYRAAFNSRDAGAAAAVWPTVNEKALARAFERLDEQAVEFDQCQLEIDDDRAEAACRGTARYVPSVGSRTPKVDARQWRFNLGRTAGRWTIVSVDAR